MRSTRPPSTRPRTPSPSPDVSHAPQVAPRFSCRNHRAWAPDRQAGRIVPDDARAARSRLRRCAGRGFSQGCDRARARGAAASSQRRVGDAGQGLPREPAVRRFPRDARTRRRAGGAEVGDLVPGQSRRRPADRDRGDLRLGREQRRAADAARRALGDGAANRRGGRGRRAGAGPSRRPARSV